MALVLVETVVMMRMRYVVETPDGHPEYALDAVACDEATEVSQEFLDETIVSHRKISKKKFIKLFDKDNEYLSHWPEEQKLEYITKIET
jgi:hypothetical protein